MAPAMQPIRPAAAIDGHGAGAQEHHSGSLSGSGSQSVESGACALAEAELGVVRMSRRIGVGRPTPVPRTAACLCLISTASLARVSKYVRSYRRSYDQATAVLSREGDPAPLSGLVDSTDRSRLAVLRDAGAMDLASASVAAAGEAVIYR